MSNNNLADISMFENIQTKAHQSMGFSSLSVFNATFIVKDKKKAEYNKINVENWKKKFIEEERNLLRLNKEVKQKNVEIEKLKKAGKTKEQEYKKADNMVENG
jgi:hypothetical protein